MLSHYFKNPWAAHHMFQEKSNFLPPPYKKDPYFFRGRDSSPASPGIPSSMDLYIALWSYFSSRLPVIFSSSLTWGFSFSQDSSNSPFKAQLIHYHL